MKPENIKSNYFFLKCLLITGAITAMGVIFLAAIALAMIMGESGKGFALGLAISPVEKSIIVLQILSSITIAYFIGPMAVNSIVQGKRGVYVGVISLLISWTAPCILLTLIISLPYLTWDILLFPGLVAIVPAMVLGPAVGWAMKRRIVN